VTNLSVTLFKFQTATGTLTENRMTVVEGWFSGTALDHAPTTSELRPELLELLKLNAALNSKVCGCSCVRTWWMQ
jgi:magnesium-transporting ATPase (P-type)